MRLALLATLACVAPSAVALTLPAPRAAALAYNQLLSQHPLSTKVATAASLALAGDLVAQRAKESGTYDRRRAVGFVATEMVYRGLLQQHIFRWIANTFQGTLLLRVTKGALNPVAAATAERVLGNVPCSIIYYPIFFCISGLIQGLTRMQTLERFKKTFPSVYGFNLRAPASRAPPAVGMGDVAAG